MKKPKELQWFFIYKGNDSMNNSTEVTQYCNHKQNSFKIVGLCSFSGSIATIPHEGWT